MLRALSSFALLAAVLLAAVGLKGMTVESTDFDKLLRESEQIYRAQVVSVKCDWSGEGANRHIATFVRLRVLESYRGGAADEQTLEFSGGSIGDWTQMVVGMPEFHAGDVEILFVRGNHRDICPLVGIHQGRLRVVKSAADGREQIYLHDGSPLMDLSLVGKPPAARSRPNATDATGAQVRSLTLAEFGVQIRSRLIRLGVMPDEP